MKLHAALLATLLAAGTTIAVAQNASQSTPSSTDDQTQSQQPVSGQNNSGQYDQNANPNVGRNDDSQPQGNGEIAGQVSQAISQDDAIGGTVHVAVKGNKLVLSGTVRDEKAKSRAEQVASSYATQNNLKLVNHITASDGD